MPSETDASTQAEPKYEPHLTIKVGSHLDLWHRFIGRPIEKKYGLALLTKCGLEIGDHWNVRPVYNPRADRVCAKCWPHGVKEDGTAKPNPRVTADAAGTSIPAGEESGRTGDSGVEPITSTAEPLVSETPDAGDGEAAHSEGSGVLGSGDGGHVEELPKVGGAGDSGVEGDTGKEAGQAQSNSKPRAQSAKRPVVGRKLQGHSDR